MNRVALGRLACGLTLILATACSRSGLSANGPFGNSGQNSGTICGWTTPGGVFQDSFEEFSDTGGTATVSGVALVNPRHLRLVAAWVVESDGPVAGAWIGKGYPSPSKAWHHIPGAVVHHTGAQEMITLVVVVKPSGKLGTTTAIDLYYEVGGTHYLRLFTDGLEIRVGRICH